MRKNTIRFFLVLLLLSIAVLTYFVAHSTKTDTPSTLPPINSSQLTNSDLKYLTSRGLKNPVEEIVNDLIKHPELIPCKGSLGGNHGFYSPQDIKVIDNSHVTALFDDGHIDGSIELKFRVNNGIITWKAMKWNCDGAE